MRRKSVLPIALLSLIFFLCACGASTTFVEEATPTLIPLTRETYTDAYPASPLVSDTGYPIPLDDNGQFNELPSYQMPQTAVIDSHSGAVVGRLISEHLGVPIANVRIYLGEKTYSDNNDNTFVVTMREQDSFNAITDADGYFIINRVTPENYGVIVLSPLDAKLLDDERGGALYIDVQAGRVTNLGDLSIIFP